MGIALSRGARARASVAAPPPSWGLPAARTEMWGLDWARTAVSRAGRARSASWAGMTSRRSSAPREVSRASAKPSHQRGRVARKVVGCDADRGNRQAAQREIETARCRVAHHRLGARHAKGAPFAQAEEQDSRGPQRPRRGHQDGLAGLARQLSALEQRGDQAAQPPIHPGGPAPQRSVVAEEADHDEIRSDALERPVDDLDLRAGAHSADSRTSRATASRMPLTKAGEGSLPKRRARSTASLSTTADGVSV